ncbi:MAG TPA: DUF4870 domain-containing protein [Dermatophilaceae bacterium]|nr:DUF4870 domain-containing protein [Dermatophilaceae bacterium]
MNDQPFGPTSTPHPAPSSVPQPYAVAQPPLTAQEERTWGVLSHVIPLAAMILSAGTLGFVGSLVVYLLYKDRGPFVRAHAANSLNVQITMGIVLLVSVPLMLVLVGFVTYVLAFVVAAVLHVLGAVNANNGQWWEPPITIRFVR